MNMTDIAHGTITGIWLRRFGLTVNLREHRFIITITGQALIHGSTRSNFCPLPTNWGYRDSKNFWCSPYRKPQAVGIPNREIDLTSLHYAASRLNTDVKFTDDALLTIVKVPRPFLKLVLTKCVEWADENGVKVITEKEMKIINDKRSEDKK